MIQVIGCHGPCCDWGAMGGGAIGGAEYVVCVVVGSSVANGVWLPDGKAIAMMLSASLGAASAILSASAGLVIN